MEIESREQILERKKEIEKELVEMLEETESDFELEDVLDVIYNEEDNDDFQDLVIMFDNGHPENLSNVLELITDAWNYFPHEILGGISPAEVLLKHRNKDKK